MRLRLNLLIRQCSEAAELRSFYCFAVAEAERWLLRSANYCSVIAELVSFLLIRSASRECVNNFRVNRLMLRCAKERLTEIAYRL